MYKRVIILISIFNQTEKVELSVLIEVIRTIDSFILKVTDKGTPALTRYKRVVVEILPAD